jgi:hypothetical protein
MISAALAFYLLLAAPAAHHPKDDSLTLALFSYDQSFSATAPRACPTPIGANAIQCRAYGASRYRRQRPASTKL